MLLAASLCKYLLPGVCFDKTTYDSLGSHCRSAMSRPWDTKCQRKPTLPAQICSEVGYPALRWQTLQQAGYWLTCCSSIVLADGEPIIRG